jgi:hypothetical protein
MYSKIFIAFCFLNRFQTDSFDKTGDSSCSSPFDEVSIGQIFMDHSAAILQHYLSAVEKGFNLLFDLSK